MFISGNSYHLLSFNINSNLGCNFVLLDHRPVRCTGPTD